MSYRKKVDENTQDLDFDKKRYEVKLSTTLGDIRVELLPVYAPNHCRNLIGLARAGFYDNLTFHRIISGFMIQGGCPQGTGTGGPGYNVDAEFNALPHDAGVLSMARSSNPNSAGSQFFICVGRHTHLDRQYTAFGRTADPASLDVVKKIGAVQTGSGDKPTTPVVIKSATVSESAL